MIQQHPDKQNIGDWNGKYQVNYISFKFSAVLINLICSQTSLNVIVIDVSRQTMQVYSVCGKGWELLQMDNIGLGRRNFFHKWKTITWFLPENKAKINTF